MAPDHFLVRQLRRCYEHVIASVRNRACVNTPMTLDALSSIFSMCGGIPFLTDMIQKKKVIQKRTEELTDVYLRFYDYFYDFLKAEGYGESASWFQVFAEGKFESVRCDFSLMISNEMFEDFVVPELAQVCDHMDYSLFNMCSVRHARFVEPLSRIRSLNGIFWNPEPYLDGVRDYLPVLWDIKEEGMCLEIVCQSGGWARIEKAGKIVVGNCPEYPPFSFRNTNNKVEGFDPGFPENCNDES